MSENINNKNRDIFSLAEHNYYSTQNGEYTKERVIEENRQHKLDVQQAGDIFKSYFNYYLKHHDDDKNIPENAEVLAKAINTGDFKEWGEIHYLNYSHHYQWFFNKDNWDGISLFNLVECCCDNVAARLRRTGTESTFEEEYEIYLRQGFSDFEAHMMANTFILIQEFLKKDILKEEGN